MPVATFDTLKFSKALREAGVSEGQADAQASVLAEAFSFNFKEVSTKEDLKHLDERIDFKLKDLEQRLDFKLKELEQRLDFKLKDLELRLTAKFDQLKSDFNLLKWMFGVLITLMASVAVRTFFFPAK